MQATIDPNTELYSVAIGNINPFDKASRLAIKFIQKLDGMMAVCPSYPQGTLVFFSSENTAKRGRNLMEHNGIICGNHISKFIVDKDGIPVFDETYIKK